MPRSCSRPTARSTSRQTHLYRGHWFDALEVYWKDLNRPGPVRRPRLRHAATSPAAWAATATPAWSPRMSSVAPGETRTVRFAHQLVRAQLPQVLDHAGLALPPAVGRDRPVEELVRDRMDRRRDRSPPRCCRAGTSCATRPFAFRDALYHSTLPLPVLDAAAANLSILKSPTTLRLEDGTFYGWEGCHPSGRQLRGQLHACLELPAGAALPVSRRSSARCARPTTSTT